MGHTYHMFINWVALQLIRVFRYGQNLCSPRKKASPKVFMTGFAAKNFPSKKLNLVTLSKQIVHIPLLKVIKIISL